MRANHIPRAERLVRRISTLECRLYDCMVNGRRGNPYQKCRHCGLHSPQLSIDGGHPSGCPMRGMDKQIKHYKNLLANPPATPTKKKSRYEILATGPLIP
jgi:hypothetical protein